jgi:ATP-dependent RNA helicase RhlE
MVKPSLEFDALGLSDASLRAVERAGYAHPTPVQQLAIPPALEGKDVIACAATGTGKTAAFVLPIVDRLHGKSGIVALVLAPTRELAVQITRPARGLSLATLIGGVDNAQQVQELRNANVIVATPGRLVDHLQQKTLSLATVEVLVLDEADRMLDMGFKPQLTRILAKVPKARQTMLFSATMGEEVEAFAKLALREPVRVDVAPSGTTAERVGQVVFEVPQHEKTALLLTLLAEGEESTLVFTRTRRKADKLTKALLRADHRVERIHADRSQAQRKFALEGFRAGRFRVLIATDIAARGIDVAGIGHVVNYDLPHVPEDYVHRVGRTARASASGRASSFAAPEETPMLEAIEKLTRAAVPRAEVPRDTNVFRDAIAAEKARQSDPGPPQSQPIRPEGKPLGRHARTHPKKPKAK